MQKLANQILIITYRLIILILADPTYMIRAIPSNASDNIYCTLLAQSAVHGAMAGYTGFTVGPVNSRHAYIPISVSSFKAIRLQFFLKKCIPVYHVFIKLWYF